MKGLEEKVEDAGNLLREIAGSYTPAAMASSFGAEDMVLIDLVCEHSRSIEVFTIDTGRLPEETYRLMSAVRERYPTPVRVYCPQTVELERWIERNGPDGFYRSIAQRKECCHVRKVEPLARALREKKAWVTGLRRDQSQARQDLEIRSWDAANGLHKFNPLLDWSWEEVWSYIRSRKVPYNGLHDAGYPSIGCAPCTRAVAPGEDLRSGRWWWEEASAKECGLHIAGAARKDADR